jgi:hypothetical protein
VTLFGKAGVIHHPSNHWFLAEHSGHYKIQASVQDGLVTPGGVGNHVMQRLMHAPDVIGSQSGGHRFDALALARQQQGGAVAFQRNVSVSVPCGFRQAIDICRKASFLWAWRDLFAHKTILQQNICL